MSHFAVLVIGDDVAQQLAPYQENNMGDCPLEYMEFEDVEEEKLKEYNTQTTERILTPEGKLLHSWDDSFRIPGTFGLGTNTHKIPEDCIKKEIPFKDLYPTFEEFMKDYHGFNEKDEKTGKYGYWSNPQSYWDWYSIGGRWTGYFKPKEGKTGEIGEPGVFDNKPKNGNVDVIKLCDIDFDRMSNESMSRAKERWIMVHKAIDNIPENLPWSHFISLVDSKMITIDNAKESYRNQERVKIFSSKPLSEHVGWDDLVENYSEPIEEYAEKHRYAGITPFAIVYNKTWISKGKMGWWGMSNDKYSGSDWDKKIKSLFDFLLKETPETMITAVDCHI
jgi:hypothetical protein